MNKYKYDKTRLTNLLNEYRDHMITSYYSSSSYVPISKCIEEVDEAIKLVKFCIKGL